MGSWAARKGDLQSHLVLDDARIHFHPFPTSEDLRKPKIAELRGVVVVQQHDLGLHIQVGDWLLCRVYCLPEIMLVST